jgi:transposase
LGCSHGTISSGIKELNELPEESGYDARIRRPGGGRKRYDENHPGIDEAFLDVLKNNTAGDPMRENVRWTNLTQREIADRLQAEHGIRVSETVVEQLLKKHDFRRRKAQKKNQ